MLSRTYVFGMAALTLLVFGCGKSNETDSHQSTPPAAVSGPTAQESAAHQAKLAVADFLDAIRKRDDEKATRLLTKLARDNVGKAGFSIGPAVNDSTKIEIDDATFPYPEHDVADVPVRLIDVDEAGRPRTDKGIWVCRLEPEGWRIGGLMAYVFEGEDPWLFNFEKPEELAQKQQLLKEEFDRRSKPAQNPHPTGDAASQADHKPQDAFRR